MPAPLVARVAPPPPRPAPVVPDAALGEPELDQADELRRLPRRPASRTVLAAERNARVIVAALDADPGTLLAAARGTGREVLELVVELRRAARMLEGMGAGGRSPPR